MLIIRIHYLRALAAIFVVVYHIYLSFKTHLNIELLSVFSIGEIGVDIFFIISGFIMTHVTFNKKFNAVSFIKNRLIRIYPIYLFYFSIAFVILLSFPDQINRNAEFEVKLIPSLILIPYTEYSNLLPIAWTLVFEIHFYFIIALIYSLFTKYRVSILIITICSLAITSIFTNSNYYLEFVSNPIILEFAMGVLLYSLTQKDIVYEDLISSFILTSTLLILYIYSDSIRSIKYGLPSFFIMLFLLKSKQKYTDSTNIFKSFFNLAGNYSYSLYLSHIFVISAFIKLILYFEVKAVNGYVIFTIVLILCNITAYLSYNIIEQRIVKLLQNSKYSWVKKGGKPPLLSSMLPKNK